MGRARVRSLSLIVSADIHPIQNLRVMAYLRQKFEQTEESAFGWSRHWIETGFDAYEATLAQGGTGAFSHGDRPTMADMCLVPQVFQRHALQGRHEALSDHPAHLRYLHEAPGLRRGAALQAAGRRTVRKSVVVIGAVIALIGIGAAAIPFAEDYAATRLKAGLAQGGVKVETVKVGLLDRSIALGGVSGGPNGELKIDEWSATGLAWPLDELLRGRAPLGGLSWGDPLQVARFHMRNFRLAEADAGRRLDDRRVDRHQPRPAALRRGLRRTFSQ